MSSERIDETLLYSRRGLLRQKRGGGLDVTKNRGVGQASDPLTRIIDLHLRLAAVEVEGQHAKPGLGQAMCEIPVVIVEAPHIVQDHHTGNTP